MVKGFYSLGLCGYEIWPDKDDSERLMVLFTGPTTPQKARSYKVQYTTAGRPFVHPNHRRIYLDEVLRVDT